MRFFLPAVALLALAACKRPEPVQAPAAPPRPAQAVPGMAEQHAAAAAGPADAAGVTVARAKGNDARTVAEIWAQKAGLKGKEVAVQAQVVKVTPGVLGRNWIHLRDGSGTPAARDNDLVATTADEARVGTVVVARGKLGVDRDIGSGYVYPVLLEDAKLSPGAR